MKINWKLFAMVLIAAITLTGCDGGTEAAPSSSPAPISPTAAAPTATATGQPPATSATPAVETTEPGVLSPGEVTAAMIDQAVKVKGQITFVNQDPGGLAVILTGGGGQVMVRVENRILEAMTEAERSQYASGKTVTAEGMLVRAPGGELTVVLGVIPAVAPPVPLMADVDIIAGPVNISHNPTGYRGWPWPKIFTHQGKIVVTYWGRVGDWESNWMMALDGDTWSEPREIPVGTPVIGEKGIYILSSWQYTEERGHVGVVLSVLDESFKVTQKITVDTTPADHTIEKNTNPQGVVDSRGNLHVVWCRNTETATDIYYVRFDGTTLTEPVPVSHNPLQGSVNSSVAIDANDIVYDFWGEFSEGMYGGDIDVFYSCLQDDVWSAPYNLSRTDNWTEFMVVPWYQTAKGPQVNVFFMATKVERAGPTTHVVLKGSEVVSSEPINFGFGDISLASEGDRINAVFGGMGPVSADEPLTVKGEIFYNYFDGQEWYAGAGEKILPRDFYDNSELLKIIPSSIGQDRQAMVTLENGGTDVLREIHPHAVLKDGVIHTVFEYNQRGTYDAYYMAFKKN